MYLRCDELHVYKLGDSLFMLQAFNIYIVMVSSTVSILWRHIVTMAQCMTQLLVVLAAASSALLVRRI